MASFETFPERMDFETVLAAAEAEGADVPFVPKADWVIKESADYRD